MLTTAVLSCIGLLYGVLCLTQLYCDSLQCAASHYDVLCCDSLNQCDMMCCAVPLAGLTLVLTWTRSTAASRATPTNTSSREASTTHSTGEVKVAMGPARPGSRQRAAPHCLTAWHLNPQDIPIIHISVVEGRRKGPLYLVGHGRLAGQAKSGVGP